MLALQDGQESRGGSARLVKLVNTRKIKNVEIVTQNGEVDASIQAQ